MFLIFTFLFTYNGFFFLFYLPLIYFYGIVTLLIWLLDFFLMFVPRLLFKDPKELPFPWKLLLLGWMCLPRPPPEKVVYVTCWTSFLLFYHCRPVVVFFPLIFIFLIVYCFSHYSWKKKKIVNYFHLSKYSLVEFIFFLFQTIHFPINTHWTILAVPSFKCKCPISERTAFIFKLKHFNFSLCILLLFTP